MTAATQDVITTKLEPRFDATDANHDGYLDWSDYRKLADRNIQAYKLDKNDRRARALVNFCQMYWLELLRHSSVDGDRPPRTSSSPPTASPSSTAAAST
ncbi:hypothetical protein [Streptomyces griseoviridis]|uniref:hypothetical protein n=1 Tax=Streptomyces griseoviridis TaxID=45398 RepID=UPI003415E8E3